MMKGLRYYRGYTIWKGQYAINGEPKATWWVAFDNETAHPQLASKLLGDVIKLINKTMLDKQNQELWNFFHEQHDLLLSEDDMRQIVNAVKEFIKATQTIEIE